MAVLHRLTSSKSNQTTIPIMPKILPTLKVSKKGLTKSSKSIEILVIPKSSDNSNQKNVGITLDQKLIKTILASAYKTVSITEIKTKNDLVKLVNRKPDLVFSGVKYFTFGNEEIWLNDFLDTNHISYIGSSKNALNSEHDKSIAKSIIKKAGIVTAEYFTSVPGEHPSKASVPLRFPLFIKPIKGGDSIGIDALSIANDFIEMTAKVAEIFAIQKSRSLIETYLPGKEYSVGIFEDETSKELTAMPIEIAVDKNQNGHGILDFNVKKNDEELVRKVVDKKVYCQLSEVAKAAFKALGGKSFGRIDIKMSIDNIPHFIEANLMPGLSKGYFYRCCSINLGLNYEQMILKIAKNRMVS
ncbi:D-alanine--D-alanine ligase [Alphaproteobacteria bacterium]|nr:D-alanine--D-alanine ligase [Alphaproteobacteria bacterium]|tara:strand:- start:1675 stop:2745 length:1071 start_codon:yes stop_codon:yes gene_type:complete